MSAADCKQVSINPGDTDQHTGPHMLMKVFGGGRLMPKQEVPLDLNIAILLSSISPTGFVSGPRFYTGHQH